jgi:expansin (peptidoglycan-binding protein)
VVPWRGRIWIGILVALLAAPPAAGAQPPPAGAPRAGVAAFTDLTGGGACSFLGEPPDNLHVGLSTGEYDGASACGGYLDVVGPSGTVRVKITDHCPRCAAGVIDVTRKAFGMIADIAAGRVPVTYELVRNPPLDETISLRVKRGSSRWWMQIQALDHGNPLARFEIATDQGWRSLARTADNYWTVDDPGPGNGPFTVRITDIYDQTVTIDNVRLAPGEVQATRAWLYEPGQITSPPSSPSPGSAPTEGVATSAITLTPPSTAAPSQRTAADQAATGSASHRSTPARSTTRDSGGSIAPVFIVLAVGGILILLLRRNRATPVAGPRGS